MNLRLYYGPLACSLVPYFTLIEAGVDFSVEVVNFRKGSHMSPAFLRLNPKHKVQVLVIDGEPLAENIAIQLWIAKQFPLALLLPEGPKYYQAISLMAWCASDIHPFLTPNAPPQRYCDLPGSKDSVRRCAQSILHENYARADQQLAGREFFFDHFTSPDAYFFWYFRRGNQFNVDASAYPNCLAHFERMSQRPSVQKLLAFEAQVLADQDRAA
jgi:glutathione S-transferase